MKGIFTICILACFAVSSFGQGQRTVLFELFSGENSGPCAQTDQQVYNLINTYPQNVLLVHYMEPVPSAGILSQQGATNAQNRFNYYAGSFNSWSVPWGEQDGVIWDSSFIGTSNYQPVTWCTDPITGAIYAGYLNAEYSVPSPFVISVNDTFTNATDSFYATVTITATVAANFSPLTLQMAMVEDLQFTAPPGNNGETSFEHVMRNMYPNSSGTSIQSSWAVGQTVTYSFSGLVPSYVRNKSKLNFVAFIQDNTTQRVQQAAITNPFLCANDIGTSGIAGNFASCPASTYAPVINLTNAGKTTLDSCLLLETLDNVPVGTAVWRGNLLPGDSLNFQLPAFNISAGTHSLRIVLAAPNNGTDPNPGNDTATLTFFIADTTAAPPLAEGFENGQPAAQGWNIYTVDNDSTWRVVNTGHNSNHSLMVDFYDDLLGLFAYNSDYLYSPAFSLNLAMHGKIYFDRASQVISFGGGYYSDDSLFIDVSADCGNTWTTVYEKDGSNLASTATVQNYSSLTPFVPTSLQWVPDSADISSVANHDNVLLRFRAAFNNGNNLYLDNIQIVASDSVNCPSATITAASDTTFCAGGSVSLNAPQGTGYRYQWQLNGNNLTGDTSRTYVAAQTGHYTVLTSSSSCTSVLSHAVIVTVNPRADTSVTASGATTFCQGDSVTLRASSNASYLWSDNASSQSITVKQAGNYQVTVANSYGCSAVSGITAVIISPPPVATISASGNTVICQGNNLLLSAATGTGYTYQWQQLGTNIAGATSSGYLVTQSGSYAVLVSVAGCSPVLSNTVIATVNPAPDTVVTANGPTGFCQGDSVTLSASLNTSYLWSNSATSQSVTVKQTGNYQVTVANSYGCSAAAGVISVYVVQPPVAAISAGGATTICQGDSVMLTANVSAGYSYQWKEGGNDLTGATNSSYAVTATGSYDVVESAGGCTASTSNPIQVIVNPVPGASVTASGPISFCEGDSVILSAPTSSSYQWNTGATTQSVTANQSANYYVTVTNVDGCSAISEITTITVNPQPMVPSVVPSGDTLSTTALNVSYQWFANGQAIDGATNATWIASCNGAYQLRVTSDSGCSNISGALNISSFSSTCFTGILSLTAGYQVQLYPNPNAGRFNLVFSDENIHDVNIFDETGRVVSGPQKISKYAELEVSYLSNGVYFLSVRNQQDVQVLRFVIEK